MPREKECYRDILVRIDAMFPNKNLLNQAMVVKYTGLNVKTVRKYFKIDHKRPFITKEDLARLLAL